MLIDINANFNNDDFLNDILLKGIYTYKEPMLKEIDINLFNFKNKLDYHNKDNYTKKHVDALDSLNIHLKNNRFYGFPYGKLISIGFDEYIDDNSVSWHNDAKEQSNKKYLTINCFLDDCDEKTGGLFEIMNIDTNQTYSVYPKKYSIIAFSQKTDFLHRVQKSKSRRRVIEFALFFDGII